MAHYFNKGWFIEENAWHKLGDVLLVPPATRDEAMVAAGHNYVVIEVPNGNLERQPLTPEEFDRFRIDRGQDIARVGGVWYGYKPNPDKKGLEISQVLADGSRGPLDGNQLEVVNDSFAVIQNDRAYDLAEALQDLGFIPWAGITLKDGAQCALTFKLNEPIVVTGDTSKTLPFFVITWAHDGTGALRGRSTSIRAECWNTVSAGEAEGKRLGTEFTIRHTESFADRVEDAKKALKGARADIAAYHEVMEEFAAIPVSRADRELFIAALVLDQRVASVTQFKAEAARGARSPRVQANVENAQAAVRSLFNGPTIPEAHKLTAYGLHMAGVEYLDHIRRSNDVSTHLGRSLLRDEPAKARLPKLIREIAAAAA